MTAGSRVVAARQDPKAQAVLALCEARLHLILGIGPYIDRVMKKHLGPNWLDVARNRRAPDAAPSSLDDAVSFADLDDSILLRTIITFWNDAFKREGLKDIHKNVVTTCLVARNQSAHPSTRMVEPNAARSYLVAIHQLLEAVGDQDGSVRVVALKDRLSESPAAPGQSEEIRFELQALVQGVRDQLSEEAEARSKSGQKAGHDLLARMAEQTRMLQEIQGMLRESATKPSPGQSTGVAHKATSASKTPDVPITSGVATAGARAPAAWQLRRNANGSIGAVGTTRDGQGVRRLALTPAEARQLLQSDLVDTAWHAQGGWVPVGPADAERLEAELARRLMQGNS